MCDSEDLTVEVLYKHLENYIKNGLGDYKVCLNEDILQDDCFCGNHSKRQFILRSRLVEKEQYKQIAKLQKEIGDSIDKYLGLLPS